MSSPDGNRGPRSACPVCGGRAWLDPSSQVQRCLGPVVGWVPVPEGRRPLFGTPCGWSELYGPGCCGDAVNRWSGEPGAT